MQLEDRMTPATAGFSAGTLMVTADPGSAIGISAFLDANLQPTGQLVVTDNNVNLFVTSVN